MALDQYLNILAKHWKTILACCIVAALGTYVFSRLMTPLYQSTAIIQISVSSQNNQADINSLLASDQLVLTEAQLAVSDPVLRVVASHYPGLSVNQLQKNVNTAPRLNTQLFEINVLDPSPKRSALIANDIAQSLIAQQASIAQQTYAHSQQQLQQDLKQTQNQIEGLARQIEALQKRNGNSADLSILQTRLVDLQEHNKQSQASLAQFALIEAQSENILRVVQLAQQPSSPVQPHVMTNTAFGLLIGLINGLLATILYEKLDKRIRTVEALSQHVHWTILTTVWQQKNSYEGRDKSGFKEKELINPSENSINIEAYRILRTNIGFAMISNPVHSIMIVSAKPNDGKSLIAANLAIFMAKAGQRILLIDADLRRPTLDKKFQLTEKKGLSDAIIEFNKQYATIAATSIDAQDSSDAINIFLTQFMYEVDTPNLLVMPSGPLPPSPPELLASKLVAQFFAALSLLKVDMIIFDTPPLLGLSDASILMPKVDGVIIVVDTTTATKGDLKRVDTLLAQSGKHVLGCVVNKHSLGREEIAYAYSYYRYKHRDSEDSSSDKQEAGA